MHINLILIPFVIFLGFLLGKKDNKMNRGIYIILCSVVLVFIAAMRSPEWMTLTYGIDTLNYQDYFEETCELAWRDILDMGISRYLDGNDESDIGFFALNRIIGYFTKNFYVYSFIADLIFFIPFGIILYRFSTSMSQIIFAFVFYIALVQVFFFGGARQIFAMGFDLMAYLSINNKKKVYAVLFLIIGVSIHYSSILFLVPILMIWLGTQPRILKIAHAVCFLLFPIVLMYPNEIIVFMGNLVGMDKYADYGRKAIRGAATTFIFLIELLSLFCFVAIKKTDLEQNKSLQNLYVMAPLFTFFAPLIYSNGSMIRISLYYHLFLALLVPFAIDSMFIQDNRRVVIVIAIAALSLLTLADGGITYYFYWQF